MSQATSIWQHIDQALAFNPQFKSELNQRDENGFTPLMKAAQKTHLSFFNTMLEVCEKEHLEAVHASDDESVLHVAARRGDPGNLKGQTPLMCAVASSKPTVLASLLAVATKEDFEAVNLQDNNKTVFHYMAENTDPATWKAFAAGLLSDQDVEKQVGKTRISLLAPQEKRNLIVWAIGKLYKKCGKLHAEFISQFIKVKFQIQYEAQKIDRYLTTQGWKIHSTSSDVPNLQFTQAANASAGPKVAEHKNAVKVANVSTSTAVADTELSGENVKEWETLIIDNEFEKTLFYFEESMQKLRERNQDGLTPLMFAATKGKEKIFSYLLNLTVRDDLEAVNVSDNNYTIFHYLAKHRCTSCLTSIVKRMIVVGLDVNPLSDDMQTPLDLFEPQKDELFIEAELREKGAKKSAELDLGVGFKISLSFSENPNSVTQIVDNGQNDGKVGAATQLPIGGSGDSSTAELTSSEYTLPASSNIRQEETDFESNLNKLLVDVNRRLNPRKFEVEGSIEDLTAFHRAAKEDNREKMVELARKENRNVLDEHGKTALDYVTNVKMERKLRDLGCKKASELKDEAGTLKEIPISEIQQKLKSLDSRSFKELSRDNKVAFIRWVVKKWKALDANVTGQKIADYLKQKFDCSYKAAYIDDYLKVLSKAPLDPKENKEDRSSLTKEWETLILESNQDPSVVISYFEKNLGKLKEKNQAGLTPLMLAAREHKVFSFVYLLRLAKKEDLEATNVSDNNYTIFHYLAKYHCTGCLLTHMNRLIELGISLNPLSNDQQTPLDLFNPQKGYRFMVKKLRENGAKKRGELIQR